MGLTRRTTTTLTLVLVCLSGIALAGVFLVLYSTFPSTSVVLQILMSIPAAFVGGVAAIVLTDQTLLLR